MASLPVSMPGGRSAKWSRLLAGQCKVMPPAISPTSPNTSGCLMRSRLLEIFASNLPSSSAGRKPSMPPVMYDPQSHLPFHDTAEMQQGSSCMASTTSGLVTNASDYEKLGLSQVGRDLIFGLTTPRSDASEVCLTLNIWTKP